MQPGRQTEPWGKEARIARILSLHVIQLRERLERNILLTVLQGLWLFVNADQV